MRPTVFIPYVNRADLLDRAVSSVSSSICNVLILDNSPEPQIGFKPTVPLSFAQSQNFFRNHSLGSDFYFVMHNDAAASPEVIGKLIYLAETETRPWAAMFTNYDALAVYNTRACEQVGDWDVNLPQYFSDNDYFRRIRLAGFEIIDTGLSVFHEPSQTIKSDSDRGFMNGVVFPLHERYYVSKWGGNPGNETFTKPFNR